MPLSYGWKPQWLSQFKSTPHVAGAGLVPATSAQMVSGEDHLPVM